MPLCKQSLTTAKRRPHTPSKLLKIFWLTLMLQLTRTVEDAGPYKILTNKSGYSAAMFRLRETVEFFLTAQRRHFASETEKHRGIVLVFEYSVNSPLTRYAGALPEGEP